jgi:cytidine deaminase
MIRRIVLPCGGCKLFASRYSAEYSNKILVATKNFIQSHIMHQCILNSSSETL